MSEKEKNQTGRTQTMFFIYDTLYEKMKKEEISKRSVAAKAAKLVGCSVEYSRRFHRLYSCEDKDLVLAVRSGDISLAKAIKFLDERREKRSSRDADITEMIVRSLEKLEKIKTLVNHSGETIQKEDLVHILEE